MNRAAGARIREAISEALTPRPVRAPELDTAGWESLWERARTHCLTPYLCERWRDCGVLERIPPAMAERFARARTQNAERNRRIAFELAEICAAFQESGIRVLALKGLALAQQYYRDLGLRVLYDLDLMIPPSARGRALQTMSQLGYVPYSIEGRALRNDLGLLWRPKEYDWDAERVFDPQRPIFVELHANAWAPNWHGFRIARSIDLWEAHRTLECSGFELLVPSEEKLLVQLSVHYAFNALECNARLMHLLDVALLLRKSGPGLDWNVIMRDIYDCQVAPFCFLTLDLAGKICQSEVPARVLGRLRAATPVAIVRWLVAEGMEAAHGMSLYDRDRSHIYRLHWAMARDWRERANVLLYALISPWREAEGWSRLTAVARRMAIRLRHLTASRR